MVVAVLAGVFGARVAHRVREHRRRSALLGSLGAPLEPAALAALRPGSAATLEGVLARSSSEIVSFHPYGTSFLDEANVYAQTHVPPDADVVVELGAGLRARLEGPMQVLTGTSETEHKAPLARAAELGAAALSSAKTRSRVGQFRAIRGGDRVRVRGVISPAPDDDVLYRERGKAVRVTALESGEAGSVRAVLLAATDAPRTLRARYTPRDFARGMGLGVLVAAVLFAGFVARSRDRARALNDPVAERAACRATVLQCVARHYPDAPAQAAVCDDPYARGMAAFADGLFPAASAELARARAEDPELLPSLTEAEAHLFAHDFRHAALTVRAMIPRFYPGPETADKRTLVCIAEVLEARADQADGGRGPLGHDDWMNTDYRRICSQRPFAMLARELDADGHYFGAADLKAWQSHIYANAGAYDVVGNPFTGAVAPGVRLASRPIALEKNLVDRILLTPSDRPGADPELAKANDFHMEGASQEYVRLLGFAADVALFHAYAGSPARNARYWPLLDRAAAKLEAGETYYRVQWGENAWEKKIIDEERTLLSYVMSVAAAAALVAGDASRAERYAKLGEAYSAQTVLEIVHAPAEGTLEDSHWPVHKDALAAASGGDGKKLAAVLRAHHSTGRSILGRALSRIRTNRAALDAWFDDEFPDACVTCGASALHGNLADRREAARNLARPVERERLGERVARFTDALTDGEVAFELDELETFFAAKR